MYQAKLKGWYGAPPYRHIDNSLSAYLFLEFEP